MEGRNWKKKMNERQLERKRVMDRLGQRRARQQVKRNVAQLEDRLAAVLRGDHNSLVRQLVQENAALWATVERYELKLESILLSTEECLEENRMTGRGVHSSTRLSLQCPPPSPGPLWTRGDQVPNLEHQRHFDHSNPEDSLPILHSTMFRSVPIKFRDSSRPWEVVVDDIVEFVTSWKLLHHPKSGFEFIVSCCALDSRSDSLTAESIRELAKEKSFYANLLERLVPDAQNASVAEKADAKDTSEIVSEVEIQRRAIALCACEIVTPWRSIFRSVIECISIFWKAYNFFMFLAFPTPENLAKVPSWLWPTRSQLQKEHPLFIDILLWYIPIWLRAREQKMLTEANRPGLREKLSTSWHIYSPKDLSVHFVRHFQVYNFTHHGPGLPISVKEDQSGLKLEEGLETTINNLNNWILNSAFFAQFPDLISCVTDYPSEHLFSLLRAKDWRPGAQYDPGVAMSAAHSTPFPPQVPPVPGLGHSPWLYGRSGRFQNPEINPAGNTDRDSGTSNTQAVGSASNEKAVNVDFQIRGLNNDFMSDMFHESDLNLDYFDSFAPDKSAHHN
ncbi:uncharacterized protein Z518_00125 [Rhinocladiella mackenziei CBS 650.93]|uniref:Rhinocladiella mackenziei CBS 650.93 unplaced genomic scaffold supercont1.1, whole genome shotgun sequence n=1 Tax=Rhinocladiella mackenziei CBS 650.93 TaxID=1442369 RepID=A0A0D2G3D4_9EURO|nr:uncharacterized protein Z518_00125 [Rhinocladiella mackenziei CBS 650.93]KIX09047.1 hypothetical protein Z518_00125 [Rhinocladiella mackenziei CBS 650.93]